MALLDDRAHLPPKAEAEDWLAAFETALQAGDADAAAGLFLAGSLWSDLLAFTWTIQTIAGRPPIEAMLRERLARTKAGAFPYLAAADAAAMDQPATKASRKRFGFISATPSPTRSAQSGASTTAASCATCGG